MNISLNSNTPMGDTPLLRLNAVRIIIALFIALGYASTMPIGPEHAEWLQLFGYQPSWYGIQVIFFLSGFLGLKSLHRHNSAKLYLSSRAFRNLPILAIYTFVVISVIYPLFCAPDSSFSQDIGKLGIYFFQTVSMIEPGRPLLGLLDDSLYTCLIQGAIWTLRWGAFAHICLALGWHFKFLRSNFILLPLTLIAVLTYSAATYYTVKTQNPLLDSVIPGLRLGYAFLAGTVLYSLKDKFPKSWTKHAFILAGLFLASFIHATFIIWTPFIEILTSAFFSYLALAIILTPTSLTHGLSNWPNLMAPIYFSSWPVTQVLMMSLPGIEASLLVPLTLGTSVLVALVTHWVFSGTLNRKVTARQLKTS